MRYVYEEMNNEKLSEKSQNPILYGKTVSFSSKWKSLKISSRLPEKRQIIGVVVLSINRTTFSPIIDQIASTFRMLVMSYGNLKREQNFEIHKKASIRRKRPLWASPVSS